MTLTSTIAVSGMSAGESPQPGPATVRSIREVPGFSGRIVGLLYDAMDSGIHSKGLLDHAFVMPYPSSGSDAILSRLEFIHERTPIDVLIPTLDAELPAYVRLEPQLLEMGIRMFLPTESQLEARSKSRLGDMSKNLGILAPKQKLVTSMEQISSAFLEFDGDVMVKGPYYEAFRASNAHDAARVAAKIVAKWGFPIILQECIAGEEYDLALLGDGTGITTGAVAIKKMALTDKGKAFSGMAINDRHIFDIGLRFIKGTQWRGPLELEFVKAAHNNKYYLIEINPRFPAWIYLASQVGQNLPWAVVRMALGEEVAPYQPYTAGAFFVRHATDLVCNINTLEKLTMDGELQLT